MRKFSVYRHDVCLYSMVVFKTNMSEEINNIQEPKQPEYKDDAYDLSEEEKAKLEAEAEEFRNENDLPF